MIRLRFSSRSCFEGLLIAALLALVACDGSDPREYAVGGTVSGLDKAESVTLSDNGADTMTVSANEAFVFPKPVPADGSYTVTVLAQPTGQICTVTNGTGAGVTAQVSNIAVACSAETFVVSGSVSGLQSGEQLVLEDNAADPLTVSKDGSFTFATPVAFDGSYAVTVSTQPPGTTCSVTQGRGAGVIADVTNVSVVCSVDSYTIGGSVTGLASGAQVTLDNNSGNPLVVHGNGVFTFTTPIAYNGSYNVTVGTEPVGQTCTVGNGTSNTGVQANVTNVSVTCSTNAYTIGGSLSGLAGSTQVTLFNNGADPLTLTADGPFTFNTPVAYGTGYAVTIGTQPSGQICTVAGGSASQTTADVTSISVSCMSSTVSFTTPGTYTWTVPQGATSISVVVKGGGGGGGGKYGTNAGQPGGAGASVTSTLVVSSGQVLNLVVGGGGVQGADGPGSQSQFSCGAGGGGGGASSVDAGNSNQVVAGGGGGGGSCHQGPAGGSAGGTAGAGGNGLGNGSGSGGSGGIGGAGGHTTGPRGNSGGNGSGGAGGAGGNNGSSILGGAGGSGIGAGTGGTATFCCSGGGGGGYGGGGAATGETGGGAGGSGGPTGTVYSPASNGGASSTAGGNGSVVITAQ